jgi:hypothetical protein
VAAISGVTVGEGVIVGTGVLVSVGSGVVVTACVTGAVGPLDALALQADNVSTTQTINASLHKLVFIGFS